jgi:hypothetical protein
MSAIRFDHLVVAARTLEEGVAWVEARTGAAMGPGGKHAAMSTHNRLLSLGPGRFLEVIAIDPAAPPPGRARWFELDTAATAARLAQGPALVHWVIRADDLEGAIDASGATGVEILPLSRGDYRWRIGVTPDGRLAMQGVAPTVIRWEGAHPADRLPDSGCHLERLSLGHAGAGGLLRRLQAAGLDRGDPVEADSSAAGLRARIRTPRGIVELA